LQHVRDAADRWVTVFSTLLSISTIIGLDQGRDAFSKLALGTQAAVVIAFIAAIATFIWAITSGTEASIGKLTPVPADPDTIEEWYFMAIKILRIPSDGHDG